MSIIYLSIHLSHLSTYYLPVYQSIYYLPVYPLVIISVYPPIYYLPVYPLSIVYLSIHLSIIYMPIHLSITYLSIHLSNFSLPFYPLTSLPVNTCLFVCVSINQSIYLCNEIGSDGIGNGNGEGFYLWWL